MTAGETGSYIRHRLICADGTGEEIYCAAITCILELSSCIPRLMNRARDLSVVYAAADGLPKVTEVLVKQCKRKGPF